MNFFEAQDLSRRRARKLLLLFAVAVAAVVLVVYLLVSLVTRPLLGPGFHPRVFWWTFLLTTGFIFAGSAYRTFRLRMGGPGVAALMGGRLVRPDTRDEAERRLLNVVEEMAIASGVPVPRVYVLDRESGINAFAAGWSIHDVAIAVTGGALRRLDRDEMQGVVAHEFSHILNGDMALNLRLMGVVFGILQLTVAGRILLWTASRTGGREAVLLGGPAFLLLIVGYIGSFFSKLIKAAVLREREYLADAAAVQFTRNPAGLAGALKKIGGLAFGSVVTDPHAEELSHVFFASGLRSPWTDALASHPPLVDRIQRLDPAFDGEFPVPPLMAERTDAGTAAGGLPALGAFILASVGAPVRAQVAHASDLLERIPDPLRDAAHDPDDAPVLLLALLVDGTDPAVTERQRTLVREYGGDATLEAMDALLPAVREAGAGARLPLVDLAMPTLRLMPPDSATAFHRVAQALIRADGEVHLFEYAVLRILERGLGTGTSGRARLGTLHSIVPLRAEVEIVLSALARAAAGDDGRPAAAAFASAVRGMPVGAALRFQPAEALGLGRVHTALTAMGRASAGVRRRVLEACIAIVAHDGRIGIEEAELLRAVAEALDCPIPPLVAAVVAR